MNFIKIKSNAKINLALNVISKSDKLHKIESLISFINLHDLIYIRKIRSKKHHIIVFDSFDTKFIRELSFNQVI